MTFNQKTMIRTITGPHAQFVADELGFKAVFENDEWQLHIRHVGFRGSHGRLYPPQPWLEDQFWTHDGRFERCDAYDIIPLWEQA